MKDGLAIVNQLTDHCLGDACPGRSLVESGQFPDGWVERYLALLQDATQCWKDQPSWPRELVTAIHFTSWYLEIRYKAWCSFQNSTNRMTEEQLGRIRKPSELFLMAGIPGRL